MVRPAALLAQVSYEQDNPYVQLLIAVTGVLFGIFIYATIAALINRGTARQAAAHLRCRLCGRSPALLVKARSGVGLVIIHVNRSAEATLCRDHGTPVLRKHLLTTLLTGWWGIASFFLNFWYLTSDVFQLIRLRMIGAPSGERMHAPPPPAPHHQPPAFPEPGQGTHDGLG